MENRGRREKGSNKMIEMESGSMTVKNCCWLINERDLEQTGDRLDKKFNIGVTSKVLTLN